MKKNQIVVFFIALLCLAPVVLAQSPTIPLNLPGFTTSIEPPAGFDPLTASDFDLELYGFPPRPDRGAPLAAWQHAMTAANTRLVPRLEATNIYNGPFIPAARSSSTSASSSSSSNIVYSLNWSGSAALGGATSFGSTSFYSIVSDYVVPVARQAFGACTHSWDYSSSWVGIDGYGSSDVLQAGTESDAYCGDTVTSYSAWIEWFPFPETRISNLPVTAGDDIFVEVWNTSSTSGHAYFVNYRTGITVSINFSPPEGTTLKGNSAEWIVERPGVGGGLATLTNYIWDNFNRSYATTHASAFYDPGSAGAAQITMLDNNGQPISYPTVLAGEYIWFRDEGSAYGSGPPKNFGPEE